VGSQYRVEVTGGTVEGVLRRGLRMWRGIPYAAGPTGARRFRAPGAVEPWDGIRDATEFGPIAPQDRNGQFRVRTNAPMSEDCLSLNVIAPRDTVVGAPVMVFIHGGAYSVGSSREIRRQGEGLVRKGGVVFVTLNYRLGSLGWLDLSSFSTRQRPIESNLGLRDHLAALAWVQHNIAAFGGDPVRVTLFGESAGANAVTTLMTVPAAAGLFSAAIAQSSPANGIYPPEVTRTWASAFVELLSEEVDDSAIESTSVEDAAGLLATASVGALVRATTRLQLLMPDRFPGTVALSPVIDGQLVPERPLDAFKAGRAHPVPLIIGTNDREGSLFRGRLDILATTPPRIRAIFANTPKRSRKALKAQYPDLPAPRPAADFGGDFAFWYPSVKVAERHSRFAEVHMYRFDIATRLLRLMGLDATHGLELFALFDRMNGLFGRGLGVLGGRREFMRAGARMQRWWLAFAHTGSPGDDWPRYSSRRRRTLIIDRVDRVEKDPRAERRLAWQNFVPHV
jgi:para-nitrobenzyl esterase